MEKTVVRQAFSHQGFMYAQYVMRDFVDLNNRYR